MSRCFDILSDKLLYCEFIIIYCVPIFVRGRCGRDRMVVGYTTTCAISVYHH